MVKLVILGLDGVGPWLIEKLLAKQRIPHIQKIIQQGFFSKLRSTSPPLSVPAWPCMVSGKTPGEIDCFTLFSKKGYHRGVKAPHKYTPFWDQLNVKVGLINIPGTYPAREVNGFMMSGGLLTSSDSPDFIYPEQLKEELKEELKDFKWNIFWTEEDDFLNQIKDLTSLRFKILEKSYQKYNPEILMFVETNTDIIQHYFMKYIDEENPLYKKNEYEEKVYSYFEHLDQLIGNFIQKLDSDTAILILSDHGMTSLKGNISLNKWLSDQGYLVLKHKKSAKVLSFLAKVGFNSDTIENILKKTRLKKYIFKLFWGSGLSKIIPDTGGVTWYSAVKNNMIDFSKTKAFSAAPDFIYINDDSEENGLVKKEEYEKVREEIIEGLKRIDIPGAKIEVKRQEEIYKGEYLSNAPDIIVYDSTFHYWPTQVVNAPTLVLGTDHRSSRSGGHHIDGMFITNKNILNKSDLEIQDVYHYIMRLFKHKHNHKDHQNIKHDDVPVAGEEEIIKRLEDLGYLG